jgi:hypothetical protein
MTDVKAVETGFLYGVSCFFQDKVGAQDYEIARKSTILKV